MGGPPRDLEHAEPFGGRRPLAREPLLPQPALEGVRPQVPPHDQPGDAVVRQAGEPRQQQLVQRVLADADRRVRPDLVEEEVGRDVLRPGRDDAIEAVGGGVVREQPERAFVDVDPPDARPRRA